MRHHDHLGPRPPPHRVGNRLSRAERAVVGNAFDLVAQFAGDRIAGGRDAQDLRQQAARPGHAARRGQRRHRLVAQAGDGVGARPFQPDAPRYRRAVLAHAGREPSQRHASVKSPDAAAVSARSITPLSTATMPRCARACQPQAQRLAEPSSAPPPCTPKRPPRGRLRLAVGVPGLVGDVHARAGRPRPPSRPARPRADRREPVRVAQRLEILVRLRQRGVALAKQFRHGAMHCSRAAHRPRMRAQDREVDRNRRVGVLEQMPFASARDRAPPFGEVAFVHRDRRRFPGQHRRDAVVAADGHLARAARFSRLRRGRRRSPAAGAGARAAGGHGQRERGTMMAGLRASSPPSRSVHAR